MKYILTAALLSIASSQAFADTPTEGETVSPEMLEAIAQSADSRSAFRTCLTLSSTSYERVTDEKLVGKFTVSPECARKVQSYSVVSNDSGANFRISLVDSNGQVVRASSYAVAAYPASGTYFWIVKNLGYGDGTGRFVSETRHTR
ncbi:hypothetical protein K6Y31_04985 [Motilimonas cestriensis]|uniref:Uncharacterized protein n=1 Tax=Motilimonas cestriensis TaxID=2742685 RepID=A0ABS8W7B1_9GAMM|nr:hypothetical protein [Motilimonas cestriensis]MCE2594165.1 hypothetical protein [Motilimonas cestriensis]